MTGRESGRVSTRPETVSDRLKERPSQRTSRRLPTGGSTTHYGRAALKAECGRVEAAPEGSRHKTLFAAACHLGELVAGRELHEDLARGSLEDIGRVIGLAESDVRNTVRRGLNTGVAKPRRAPEDGTMLRDRSDAIHVAIALWAEICANAEGGRRGAMRLKILAAFVLKAMCAGKVRLTDSYRQMAEAAGVSVGTFSKYAPTLPPYVQIVSKGNRVTGDSTVWQLRANLNRPEAIPAGEAGLFNIARGGLSDPSRNQWHCWPTGWRVLTLLSDDEQTAAELSTVTGLSVGGMRKILNRLAALGMATRDANGGWTAAQPVIDPHEDGLDHAAERRERHIRDRQNRTTWIADGKQALDRETERKQEAERKAKRKAKRYVDPETGEVRPRAA